MQDVGDREKGGNCIPESTRVSSVLSLLPLLLKSDMDFETTQSHLRIVGVVITIVPTLSSSIILKFLEVVLETHDD